MPYPCDDLLPLFLDYGIKDGACLLGLFRMRPEGQRRILEYWLHEGKVTKFQYHLLEDALKDKHRDAVDSPLDTAVEI